MFNLFEYGKHPKQFRYLYLYMNELPPYAVKVSLFVESST